jgi:hypothetical protein
MFDFLSGMLGPLRPSDLQFLAQSQATEKPGVVNNMVPPGAGGLFASLAPMPDVTNPQGAVTSSLVDFMPGPPPGMVFPEWRTPPIRPTDESLEQMAKIAAEQMAPRTRTSREPPSEPTFIPGAGIRQMQIGQIGLLPGAQFRRR